VQVDANGVVSLRGDSSVTILIDGKPSALLSGPARADMVLQLPADQFDRVEVMTTPTAAFNPEGAGGVINLITRKSAPSGSATTSLSGSMEGNFGNQGRENGGVSGALKAQKLSLSGGLNVRRGASGYGEQSSYDYGPEPAVVPVAGRQTYSRSVAGSLISANAAAEYDLDAQTRLSGNLSLLDDRSPGDQHADYTSVLQTGAPGLSFDSSGELHQHYSANSGSAAYERKISGDDHMVSVQLSLSEDHTYVTPMTMYAYTAPSPSDLYQSIDYAFDTQQADLKAEYKSPLPGKAKLILGYELKVEHDRSGAAVFAGASPSDEVAEAALSDTFKANQAVHGLYATYERTLGRLTVTAGLRLEETAIDTDQAALSIRGSQSYFGAYPSFHLTYDLGSGQLLKFSYGRRIERPGISALDPFRIEISAVHFFSGDDTLKPAITNSLEASYEYSHKDTNYQLNLYDREATGLFSTVTEDIGGGVLLDTLENVGHSRNAGLELVVNRNLTKTLSINASGTLSSSALDAANLGIEGSRQAALLSGRLSLNWQASRRDFLQIGSQASGRTLTAQGYQSNDITLNIGWRHTFNRSLSSVVTLQDPFDSYRLKTVVDTTALMSRDVYAIRAQAVFIGLKYYFGGAPGASPKEFDFTQGAAGPK
jgi:outer membrane cobalamin receptor